MKKKNRADYKNWMPIHYLVVLGLVTALLIFLTVLFFFFGRFIHFVWLRFFLGAIFGLFALIFLFFFILGIYWYYAFSYDGKRQMSKIIIEGVASYCKDREGKILDVGCGSGALTINLAKNNPNALVFGVDKWGIEYIDVTRKLCQDNAKAEGVNNAFFLYSSIRKLDYPDGYFDHVTSNYCYSNLMGFDKQDVLLETLRVLKKGGTFAIHDIMDWLHYGDMNSFVQKLKDIGFEEVHLVDTSKGMFITEFESFFLSLNGSYLLYGKK